jgi:hypothetical protein
MTKNKTVEVDHKSAVVLIALVLLADAYAPLLEHTLRFRECGFAQLHTLHVAQQTFAAVPKQVRINMQGNDNREEQSDKYCQSD